MMKADGYFWYDMKNSLYCVVVLDTSRKERNPRDRRSFRRWAREWHSPSVGHLRKIARKEGIILLSDVRGLCMASPHI